MAASSWPDSQHMWRGVLREALLGIVVLGSTPAFKRSVTQDINPLVGKVFCFESYMKIKIEIKYKLKYIIIKILYYYYYYYYYYYLEAASARAETAELFVT